MLKLSLTAIACLFATMAWSQPSTAPADRVNRPGGTTEIAPTPGPATSPALPSPSLPQAAVQNREKAKAAKTQRKLQKKAKKKPSKRTKGPQSGSTRTSNTPAGTATPPAK
ncbi:MAG TPA: hypothetical protein VFC24_05105 [Casimicrobiaceae bacterium]|nr:hypothetical protein [Casimicrobiaceae bacterium]